MKLDTLEKLSVKFPNPKNKYKVLKSRERKMITYKEKKGSN